MDFGSAGWLFVLAVENLSTSADWFGGNGGSAIVSGFVFEKRADSVRLIWHDRAIGQVESGYMGRKGTVERGQADLAVNDGITHLLAGLPWRAKGHSPLQFAVDEESFVENCDRVWEALRSVIDHTPRRYPMAFLDPAERMVLYESTLHFMGGQIQDSYRVDLMSHEGGCELRFADTFYLKRSKEARDLTKKIHASLSK